MPVLLKPQSLSLDYSKVFPAPNLRLVFDFKASARLKSRAVELGYQESGEGTLIVSTIDPTYSHEQGYSIKTETDKLILTAKNEVGTFYGLSLINWIQNSHKENFPAIFVKDWPELDTRGYMLDISRCKVPKIEALLELIDKLSSLRYNQLQLYTEHTFAYKGHQQVWQDSSPYDAHDIQTIDTYCKERFIELVPNQNSFGHLERWLRYDEYKYLAECPNGYEHPLKGKLDHGGTLKPNQDSLNFVESLYGELLPNFSSSQINIGCDETWELGLGWSSGIIAESSKRKVYLDFLLSLNDLAKGKGFTIQYWGDIILESPELVPSLPKDGIGLVWGYECDHPFDEQCNTFNQSGIPYLVCPGTSTWNTIGGRYENAKLNVEDAIAQAIKHDSKGFLLTDWGDDGHHHPTSVSLPAIARAAALSWNSSMASEAATQQIVAHISSEPKMAEILSQLGKLPDLFELKPHNASPLNLILFGSIEKCQKILQEIPKDEFSKAQQEIDSIRCISAKLSSPLYQQQIDLCLDLLDFACKKGISLIQGDTPRKISLTTIVSRFRDLWLSQNRPGGLQESVEKLTANN
ncbi:family 20 glycosylhydrolase [Puniceicoccaceae bacterium K14]|nr:family 20 glycosylhydrolase [Puniceicoccaceae bacterium K14]